MTSYALYLAAGLLVFADAPKDLKRLEGTWVLVSGENDGKKVSADALKKSRLTFEGDKHTVKEGDTIFKGTHKLEPTKTPKAIDITDTEGPFKGKTVLGIYVLDGDEFKICYALPGKDRPEKFSAKAGTGYRLHVWKREKK